MYFYRLDFTHVHWLIHLEIQGSSVKSGSRATFIQRQEGVKYWQVLQKHVPGAYDFLPHE